MSMRVRVRNVLGVASADVTLGKITLIVGHNGSGKSSLLNAIAAAALRRPVPIRGVTTKSGLKRVVKDGADEGLVRLETQAGATTLKLPSGTVADTGALRIVADDVTLGLERVTAMKSDARTQYLSSILAVTPGKADIASFFAQRGVEQPEAWADATWDLIEAGDWDTGYKEAKEAGTKLKGRWEQITGTRWAPSRAPDWLPDGLLPDEVDLSAAMAAADAAEAEEARVRKLVRAGGSRRDLLEEKARSLPSLRKQHAEAAAEIDKHEAGIQAARAAKAKLPPAYDLSEHPCCPHCRQRVIVEINPTPGVVSVLSKPPYDTELPPNELKARRLAHNKAEGVVMAAQRALKDATEAAATLRAQIIDAEKAAAALAQMGTGAADEAELATAELATARARATLDKVQQVTKARAVFAEWKDQESIIAALDPGGVRQIVLLRAIDTFNSSIEEMASHAGWTPPVVPSHDGPIQIAGREYGLASESEQWRADLVIQCAVAATINASLLLADRLDVLQPNLRHGALKMLLAAGCSSVVTMTVKDTAAAHATNLAKYKIGETLWMEAGQVLTLADVPAAA